MRKSIFELLEESFNLHHEVKKLYVFLTEKRDFLGGISIERYFDVNYIQTWKYRGTLTSCLELKEKCQISEPFLVPQAKIETFLAFLEYAFNLLQLVKEKYYKDYRQYPEIFKLIIINLLLVASKINYQYQRIDDEKFIIVDINPSATTVAEIISDTKVIEYNHYLLRGNIEEKRNILKLLANQFEDIKPSLKKNGYSDLADDLGFLFNNLGIRHTNGIDSMLNKKEIEEWYDKTYDMFLLSVLANNHVQIRPDIKSLKQKATS